MKERGAQKVGQIDGAGSVAFAGIAGRGGMMMKERGAQIAKYCALCCVRLSHVQSRKVGQSRMAEMQRHLQKVSAGEREAKVCPERMAGVQWDLQESEWGGMKDGGGGGAVQRGEHVLCRREGRGGAGGGEPEQGPSS